MPAPTHDSSHDLTQPSWATPMLAMAPSRRALETASAPSDGLVPPDRTAHAARNAIVADGRQCTTTDLTVCVSGVRLHPRRTPQPGLSNRTLPPA